MAKFMSEHLPVCALLPLADRWDSDPATDVYNLALYDEITFLVCEGAGGTGTTVLTVEECTSAAAAGATAIAFNYRLCASAGSADTWGAWTAATTSGYTTVAGANKMVAIRVRGNELSAGSNYVRVQTTESANDPCDAVIMAVLGKPRYAEDVMPTAVT